MKRLLITLMILGLACSASQAQSILRRLERTARTAAERAAERKVEEKVEEEPKAETKQEAKGDDKKQKPSAKEQAENVKLVGYRYTRPMFPEVLHDLEGYMLTRVDTNDQKELEEIGEENLVVAVFFPEWESGTYIDPTDLVDDNISDILQAHGLEPIDWQV